MLVLSRKRGESIVVGTGRDAAEVAVLRIDGHIVRLGVTARSHIRVDRTEVRISKLGDGVRTAKMPEQARLLPLRARREAVR